jgi:hypothetical protein
MYFIIRYLINPIITNEAFFILKVLQDYFVILSLPAGRQGTKDLFGALLADE